MMVASAMLLGVASCSGGNSSSTPTTNSAAGTTAPQRTTTTVARPSGPSATLTELSGGKGVFLGESTPPDLAKLGYAQHEFAAAGTATAYEAKGARTHDGRSKLALTSKAAYRTRVLVRAPSDASKFSNRRSCAPATRGSASPRSASGSKADP